MLLKHVYLYLSLEEYPDKLVTPFGFRTRCLCNFIERRLKPLRYHTAGFGRICVEGRHVPEESCPIMFEHAAVPSVRFDHKRYERLGPDAHHEFFIKMLREGLEKCARHHRIPLDTMLEAIDEYRSGGYRNEWVHQTKVLRPAGMRASLLCSLSAERFVLTLQLKRRGDTVFSQSILKTKPDELIFAIQFKDVALEGNSVVVRDRFGKRTFALDLRRKGLLPPPGK